MLRDTVFYQALRRKSYNHKKIKRTKDDKLWKKLFNFRSRKYVSKFMWNINIFYVYMSIILALLLIILLICSIFIDIQYYYLFLNGLFKVYIVIFLIVIIYYTYSKPVQS